MRNLRTIDSSEIARLSNNRLKEIIRKSEFLISTQLENIRAVDSRATQIMTSLGLILTIIIGVFALSEVNVPQYFDLLLVVIFCILSITTILCLFCCLKIIQSDEICPPGNDGLELLGDASDKFSEHEENVDYILVLSESRHRNEALIKRNAKLLMLASRYFFITVVLVFFASGVISLFSA